MATADVMVSSANSKAPNLGNLLTSEATEAPFGPSYWNDLNNPFTDSSEKHLTYQQSSALSDTDQTSLSSTPTLVDSILNFYNKMANFDIYSNSTCESNCSGRGECMNGTCFCSVSYKIFCEVANNIAIKNVDLQIFSLHV